MWQDRILNDGQDEESWLDSRSSVVGASDAAGYAKPESEDKYAAAKLKTRSFGGNEFTRSGHRWEPMLLAYAGVAPNKALIHAPGEIQFAATPDGIQTNVDGTVTLAEAKAKHDKIVTGPDIREWRQLAWQFMCVPEAEETVFVWAEIIDGKIRGDGFPKTITIPRDHPKIIAATALIVPIARNVLVRLNAAHQLEKELKP